MSAIRILGGLAGVLLMANVSIAAVTIAGTPTQCVAVAASCTFAFTASGNGLWVGAVTTNSSHTINSATYNGVAMTSMGEVSSAGVGKVKGFLLCNPSAGANNVVVTFSASTTIWAGAVGVDGLECGSGEAGAHRTVYTSSNQTGGPSVTVVDAAADDLVVDVAFNATTTITVDASQTSQVEDDSLAGGSRSAGMSTEVATGASTVMSWTSNNSNGAVAMALIASGGAFATRGTLIGVLP